ncbi:MAG TPA: lasso RiPP family leader peptide-containing protein [Vicinamibacterales bacterium]|jgi:hypothetical protein
MDERDRKSDAAPRPSVQKDRHSYTAPLLTEYGSVAKLTQSGGSTSNEGTVVAKMAMCL